MTHTIGFEEVGKNIMFYDPARLTSLGDYLKAWTPARIYQPGTTPAGTRPARAVTAAGWVMLVAAMSASIDNLTSALDPYVWLLEIASLIVFVGGLAVALWHAWIVWRGAHRRWQAKLWSVVLVIAAMTVLWIGLAFKMISFGVNY